MQKHQMIVILNDTVSNTGNELITALDNGAAIVSAVSDNNRSIYIIRYPVNK